MVMPHDVSQYLDPPLIPTWFMDSVNVPTIQLVSTVNSVKTSTMISLGDLHVAGKQMLVRDVNVTIMPPDVTLILPCLKPQGE